LEDYEALVAATPKNNSRRAWSKADRRWASGKRQIIEGVICQLKDFYGLERHRAKTLSGLLTRLAAKIAAHLGPTDQQLPWPTVAPPGGPVGLVHCTSLVLGMVGLAASFVLTLWILILAFFMWRKAGNSGRHVRPQPWLQP
jgi:hypothetical protein